MRLIVGSVGTVGASRANTGPRFCPETTQPIHAPSADSVFAQPTVTAAATLAKAVMNQQLQKSRDRRFRAPTAHEKQPQQPRNLDPVDGQARRSADGRRRLEFQRNDRTGDDVSANTTISEPAEGQLVKSSESQCGKCFQKEPSHGFLQRKEKSLLRVCATPRAINGRKIGCVLPPAALAAEAAEWENGQAST